MPVEVDALAEWGVGDRMLNDILRGMHPDDAAHAEWRRGTLPPGRLGVRKAKEILGHATELALATRKYRTVDLDGTRRRHRPRRRPPADRHGFRGLRRPRRLRHLLQARGQASAGSLDPVARTDRRCTRAAVDSGVHRPGQTRRDRGGTTSRSPDGAPSEAAVEVLRDLVDLYDAGRREPLPLPVKTSYAWAEARLHNGDAERAAGFRWRTGKFPGEDQDQAYARVWGNRAPLRTLLTAPRPGEEVAGERTRLGAFAARLWLPMLRAERQGGTDGAVQSAWARFRSTGRRRYSKPAQVPVRRSRSPAW